LPQVLDTVVNRAVELSKSDACLLFRFRRSEGTFSLWRAGGPDAPRLQHLTGLAVKAEQTLIGEAVERRAPMQADDLAAMPEAPLRDAALEAGLHAALVLPLVRADRVFGALVAVRREAGAFAPNTVDVMQTFANQSVLAIQNARLFREVEENGRQLEIASQHKSQFLANMSHELRTPLNAVLGYAELLLDNLYGEIPAKARGVLERVQVNGQHLLALINDVLDLSKIEAGQLTLSLESYAMASVVESVVTAAEPLASAKGLALKASVADGLPLGHGDERRLTQVLLNLVGNAIKFTDQGSVEIGAGLEDGLFVITVADTGPGIAPEDQARIFEAFQQVDNTSTRKKGGTGLGLAISKRIVEMHGGQLTVASDLGSGSVFRVTLPVHVGDMLEAAE
jgi:signal transduction histidine kinase